LTAADARAPGAALLELRGVSAAPAEGVGPAVSDVSFRVQPGERVALVGPSGAGKTTLLRTLNGRLKPRAGQVIFEDVDLGSLRGRRLREVRAHIGLITQKHDLVDALRVDKNVMAGALGRWSTARALRFLFWSRAAELQEAEAALAAVGLAAKLKAGTSTLSGGQQQRVAVARALVQAPRLLLADEPVASLDPKTAVEVLDLLTGLTKARGMALICSLHQPDLAARFFDRILEVRAGRLVERQQAADLVGTG
jgi:phosphonate transport system ATP-binding protein